MKSHNRLNTFRIAVRGRRVDTYKQTQDVMATSNYFIHDCRLLPNSRRKASPRLQAGQQMYDRTWGSGRPQQSMCCQSSRPAQSSISSHHPQDLRHQASP